MIVEYKGISADHKAWAAFLGVTEQTFRWRLKHWGTKRAVTTPKVKTEQRKTPHKRRKKIETVTIAEVHRLYLEGHSEDDIGATVGLSRRTVSTLLKRAGLKFGGSRPKRITEITAVAAARVVAKADGVAITFEVRSESA